MNDELVLLDKQDRIAYVTLNRPEKLNALTPESYERLREIWTELAEDDSIRVAILRGAGRAFSVGNNLGGRENRAHETIIEDRERVRNMIKTCLMAWDLPKPVISQVHGHCFAGGSLVATLTDIIVVAEDTRIGWPQVPVGGGLIGPIWSWFVSPHRAKEFSYRVGWTMSGKEAVDLGWGNHAVPAAELESTVLGIAEQIAKVPADILRMKKAAHNETLDAKGFRSIVYHYADIDAVAHFTDGVKLVNSKLGELGIRGAIDWYQKEGA